MILDARGNVQQPKGPRRTECSSCGAILIEGEGGQEGVSRYGKAFEICPGCVYQKMLKLGMKPEQMITSDIVHKGDSPPDKDWGVGFAVSIKGIHNKPEEYLEMVITEEDLKGYLKQIKEAKGAGK